MGESTPSRIERGDRLDALTTLLIEALRALAQSGRPQDANRLAGRAWAVLRRDEPRHAQRIKGLMHKISHTYESQGASHA